MGNSIPVGCAHLTNVSRLYNRGANTLHLWLTLASSSLQSGEMSHAR